MSYKNGYALVNTLYNVEEFLSKLLKIQFI